MQEVSGSIPLTSTNQESGSTMHKLGVISVLLGLGFSIIGLVVGFTLAIGSGTGEQWFTLVPLGFVFLLLGVTLTQLGRK